MALYIKHEFSFCIRDDITVMKEKLFESLFIDIYFNKTETITVYTIYRSPHNDTKSTADFLNHLKPTLQTITKSKTQTIVSGDLNFNLLDGNNTNIHTFINSMYENGFYSLISKPTRITTQSATLIDHAWTNIIDHSVQNGIVVTFDTSEIFQCKDVNIAYNKFITTFNIIFNESFPLRSY